MVRQIRTGITKVNRDHLDRHRLNNLLHRHNDDRMIRHRHYLANALLDLAGGKRDDRSSRGFDQPLAVPACATITALRGALVNLLP